MFILHKHKILANRRGSRPAVARVGIGMCGLVALGHGPCTAVESVPNSRLVPAMMAGRRPDCCGGYRRAQRLRPETEQAQVLSLVGEWITCSRLVMESPWPLAHQYHMLLTFALVNAADSHLLTSRSCLLTQNQINLHSTPAGSLHQTLVIKFQQ